MKKEKIKDACKHQLELKFDSNDSNYKKDLYTKSSIRTTISKSPKILSFNSAVVLYNKKKEDELRNFVLSKTRSF